MIVCMGFPENLKSSYFKQSVSEMVMNCQLHKMMKEDYVRILGVHSGLTTSVQFYIDVWKVSCRIDRTGFTDQWMKNRKERVVHMYIFVAHKLTALDPSDLVT